MVCFSAIAQGDQLGVEFACESHFNLLRQAGLLASDVCLSSTEGLVIDDYFCVSVEPARPFGEPACISALKVAKEAY